MTKLNTFTSHFKKTLSGILPRRANSFTLPLLPASAVGLVASSINERLTYIITPSPSRAEQVASDLQILQKTPVIHLPPADKESLSLTGERITLAQQIITSTTPLIVVASIHALIHPVPEAQALRERSIIIDTNEELLFDTLSERLTTLGYRREELVVEPLTFALRGGILDVWGTGDECPYRIEFFGDTIETIRRFDPASQCSVTTVKHLSLLPGPNVKIPLRQLLSLSEPASFIFDDYLLIDTALSQLPLINHSKTNVKTFEALVEAKATHCVYLGDPAKEGLGRIPLAVESIIGVRELGGSHTKNPEFYTRTRHALLYDLDKQARSKERVYICGDSEASIELISQELPPDSPICLCVAPISEGFTCANARLTLIAQSDLYPIKRTWHPPLRQKQEVHGQRLEFALDVEPGELVVHLEHGIGRFIGLTEIVVDTKRIEVFTLEYANGAKLHVPTTHAHLLSRYIGPNPKKVKLHNLDGKRWQKEKRNAEHSVEDLAAGLLETQARRQVAPGFAYDVQAQWIAEFEAMFPYQETVDQTRIIAEIKADMASECAMDRLICGDAGYGKTEVAMRAAFIAVMNHKQVAILVPTTVLAEQHYETFSDRMGQFPVQIDVLSRFRTLGQRTKTRDDATQGKVDILIGTHALLSDNLPFKDLGLLIIDEEQRFGVAHKEKIKQLRSIVDVLTLSATPIPRTLYLSMTGARDLSLLQSPPMARIAVETIIQRDNDDTIRTAIRRELARGGQVFYLYNRVLTIGMAHDRLSKLVPEAKIAIAHGQMSPRELAPIMRRFEAGETNLLISTTIIESGIDIPRANTILIDRADRFGIADLYQLRGRVGRSIVKGFAYLLIPENGSIDSDARQRMQALKRHSGLGAGYNLALRDLEIRGSGNLLGAAQSGHIASIGFNLYCQLLRRTVARMKGHKLPTFVDVELSLDFLATSPGDLSEIAATLPYSYIEDELQRMNIHRRLAEAVAIKEIKALAKELTDRYGKMPDSVKRFLKLAELRIIAAQCQLSKIEVKENKLTLFDRKNRAPLSSYRGISLKSTPDVDKRISLLTKTLTHILQHSPPTT